MKTSRIPKNILNLVSFACGYAAATGVLTPVLIYIIFYLHEMGAVAYIGLMFGSCAAAILAGLIVRALSLAAMVYLTRGREALEWCPPSECATFSGWLGCEWGFPGARGWQEGIRLFGLGIALSGTHGTENSHG
jgi:hypothetical protein